MPYQHHILDEGKLKSIDHYKNMDSINGRLESLYQGEYSINRTKIENNIKYNQIKQEREAQLARDWEKVEKSGRYWDAMPPDQLNYSYPTPESKGLHLERGIKDMTPPWEMTKKDLYSYFKMIPYKPCWMLNISPDWKLTGGTLKANTMPTTKMVAHIRKTMNDFYQDANRFTKIKYVIEGGKEAKFLHVHAVFELNMDKPNNIAHMKKGNFLKSFRTIWNKDKKWEGLVGSKYALQTTYLTTKEMLQDKLDYLIEEKKPLSHQNHSDFKSIVVGEWD